MALFGTSGIEAEAGAMLLADALMTVRGYDGVNLRWPAGRGGL